MSKRSTSHPSAPEPYGFAAWWATWYRNGLQHGRRSHYAEAYRAGMIAAATDPMVMQALAQDGTVQPLRSTMPPGPPAAWPFGRHAGPGPATGITTQEQP